MKIFVFVEHYPNPYKPYLDTQLVEFLRRGHELTVFAGAAYRSTVHPEVLEHGLDNRTRYYPTTLRDLRQHLGLAGRLLAQPHRSWRQYQRIRDSGRSTKANIMALIRSAVLPKHIEPDLCLIHNLATADCFTFLRRLFPRATMAMYFHGGEVGGAPRVSREREIFANMDVVFTNTKFSSDQAAERGCDSGKIRIVPVGFNTEDYLPPPSKHYRPKGVLRLVSIGRMGHEKGYEYAIRAVQCLVESGQMAIRYHIVGVGQEYHRLRQMVTDAGLDGYVRFQGELSKPEVIRELSDSDVLVLPSLITSTWAETQACVVQEAMLMTLPVIITRAGGVPEVIPDELRPYVVAPGDVGAIAGAVRMLAALDDDELSTLGALARHYAEKHFDIRKLTDKMLGDASAVRPDLGYGVSPARRADSAGR